MSRSLALVAALLAGCAIPAATPLAPLASPGYKSPLYGADRMWLCRPDLTGDPCHGDQSATVVAPDGTRSVELHAAEAAPDVDCFYVYPTVDLGIFPGNHGDFADRDAIVKVALAQAAGFDEVCAVYVPFYRQITIGTYFWDGAQKRERMDVAFSDVREAFLHYLGQYNRGHRIVLIGHSQGAEMVMHLVHTFFDEDPELRARLVAALAIGGPATVRHGTATGRLHDSVPACATADQVGCVVGYHSYRATGRSLRASTFDDEGGEDNVCVDPTGDGAARWKKLAGAVFPARMVPSYADVKTPFVIFRDRYWGTCVEDGGRRYLLVADAPAPGDVRKSPIDLGGALWNTDAGLHVLDMQLPFEDLVELVRRKAGHRAR